MSSKPSLTEFVAITAMMMGLTAFSIDNLLPAFGPISESLHLADPTRAQLVIIAFMAPFALGQVFCGPLSDRFGRKPVLLWGLVIYVLGSLIGFLSTNFEILLVGRFLQGVGAASPRILAVAIVRDRFAGREMARILSQTTMVFIIIPIVAPAAGSLVMSMGSWRLIFLSMLIFGLIAAVWIALRLPETFTPAPEGQSGLSRVFTSVARIFHTREAIGNATAMSFLISCLMTYIVSAPLIFETGIYNTGRWFPLLFGMIAFFMGAASFLNSMIVRRAGMHRLSRIGLVSFGFVSALLVAEGLFFDGRPPLLLFMVTMATAHFLFSMTVPNLNAMAMEPLGDIAGTAASFIGFYSTLISAILCYAFGAAFNGTIIPLGLCYLSMSSLSLLILFWISKGRAKEARSSTA